MVVISGNHINRTSKIIQDIDHFLDENAVDSIVFKGIARNQNEVDFGTSSGIHGSASSGQSFIPYASGRGSDMDGFHSDLPVSGMQELHDKQPLPDFE